MTLPLRRAGMSSPGNLSEEQVHCSICLDVFTNPVSIPCGHNFCQACILGYWKSSPLYQCPMCKKSFYKRPDLSVNTVLREIAEQFKEMRMKSAAGKAVKGNRWTVERHREEDEERLLEDERDEEMNPKEKHVGRSETDETPSSNKPPESPSASSPPASPPPATSTWQEVLCDVCLGEGRPKAVKSCLVCLTSYCEEHLKSHATRFTKHKLIEPVANMEDRMCPKHQRLLELFCKKDQTCVCVLCTETDHRAHYTVPVEREWTEKRAQLKKIQVDVQQLIQDRVRKVEDIKRSVDLNKESAKRETEESIQVFSELVRSIQRTQADVVAAIEEKQRHTESRAQDLVAELEREIEELRRRGIDLENMDRTDHIHFLKNFPAMSATPPIHDWTDTNVPTDVSVGMIRTAVSKLETTFKQMVDKLADREIQKVLKYTEDVTLDPDTANPWLQLSQDRRQVRHLGAWQDLPDHPNRFDTVVIVLGREGFTSGRHYWEVQVGEKDDWYLGVAKSSVKRKGRISVSSAHGYWALAMKKGQGYRVSTVPPLSLALNPKPKSVGVYVDYDEGQISFYDVSARTHLYTFNDRLTEKILPFFYLYCCDKASDTVVICPVAEKALIQQS
ncbi:E3 ubiquitin-protein ligase TRIM39 [Festucalex cinctus]